MLARLARTGALLTVALVAQAHADVITVKTYLTGGFQAHGGYTNSIPGQNYRVGHSPVTTDPERRNFFLFDFTAMAPLPPGSVLGGSLNLYVPKFAPPFLLDPGDGYISPDPFEVYRVTATPFTPDAIATPAISVPDAIAIYTSLGTGPLVGEVAVSAADMGTFLSIPLSPAAVSAINGAMGTSKVAMGGRLTSLSFIPPDELVFGFTDMMAPHMEHKEPFLSLTIVPAPGGLSLVGALGIASIRRRRR